MAQSIGGIYAALRLPWIYSALQLAIARTDTRRLVTDRYIRANKGDRVVDIGCGPGGMLPYLDGTDYIGIDLDPNYVEAATRNYGDRGRFIQGDVTQVAEQIRGQADIVLAMALLHHLDDRQARALFGAAVSLLRPGGRLVTLDCVWTTPQNPIARAIIAADRGKNTRTREGYVALAREFFPSVDVHLHDDLLRVPYTHCIMICHKEAEA